jgi:hypothetical protein
MKSVRFEQETVIAKTAMIALEEKRIIVTGMSNLENSVTAVAVQS